MSKGTTHRTVRIEDGLWEAAKVRADAEGVNLSEVIRAALVLYAEDRHPKMTDAITAASSAHVAACPQCQETFG
jgi:hypothetical protein